jgi:hypothetical protein
MVDLCVRHHPDDAQVGRRLEHFPQLDEPRLRIRSPVHTAFESEQHAMTEQILAAVSSPI